MSTTERKLAITAARDFSRREKKTAGALLRSEARALIQLRLPVRQATDALVAAQATGRDAIAQVRRQAPALQGALRDQIVHAKLDARAAGRGRIEEDLGRLLHAAPSTLVEDDAFAEIVASSLATAWGQAGLQLLSGNSVTVTAKELEQLVALVDGRVRRVAATETARSFNNEREALAASVVVPGSPGGHGRDDGIPAAGAFKIWSAILDRATCPRCFAVDGEVVELHKSFSLDPPPVHPHCRCIIEHIFVPRPARLEDIAIDYDLFKKELRDVILEGRAESQRHALSFASDSLGARRSPTTLTKRFADERYATTMSSTGGGGTPPARTPPAAPPAAPRRGGGRGGQPPAPPPPGGGGGGSSGGRKPLDFQFGFSAQDVKDLGARPSGNVDKVTRQLFGRQCPTPDSWHRLFETPPGYSLAFTDFTASPGELHIRAKIVHPDGRHIGCLKRTFSTGRDGLTVSHDLFEIPKKEDRGAGVAKSVNRAALQGYREMGVRRITITAALEDGPIAWAKQGFSWEPNQPYYEKRFHDFVLAKTGDAAEARQAAALASQGAYRVWEYTHGNERVGEQFLKSLGSWSGGMRLDDSDPRYRYAKQRFGL